jgi:NADPH2:quinone reductase
MRAWRVYNYGPYRDELRFERDVEAPTPSAGQALVRVLAAGVNFADILSIAGRYQVKAPLPLTPGSELVGEVMEAGAQSHFHPGDRVVARTLSGGFAEFALVDDGFTFPLPAAVEPVHAAAMLVTYGTSHVALFLRAALQPGEWLLVHGGAGGVGTAAIQLGKRAGARVIATAGGADKLRVCRECGADEVIDYRAEDFVERVREITGGQGADVIYDPIGGDVFDASAKCIAWEGRLLVIGFASGRIPEIAANRIMLKNISVVGVNWPDYAKRDPTALADAQESIWSGYAEGALKPVIWKTLPLDAVPDALAAIEDRASYGKIVIDIAGSR